MEVEARNPLPSERPRRVVEKKPPTLVKPFLWLRSQKATALADALKLEISSEHPSGLCLRLRHARVDLDLLATLQKLVRPTTVEDVKYTYADDLESMHSGVSVPYALCHIMSLVSSQLVKPVFGPGVRDHEADRFWKRQLLMRGSVFAYGLRRLIRFLNDVAAQQWSSQFGSNLVPQDTEDRWYSEQFGLAYGHAVTACWNILSYCEYASITVDDSFAGEYSSDLPVPKPKPKNADLTTAEKECISAFISDVFRQVSTPTGDPDAVDMELCEEAPTPSPVRGGRSPKSPVAMEMSVDHKQVAEFLCDRKPDVELSANQSSKSAVEVTAKEEMPIRVGFATVNTNSISIVFGKDDEDVRMKILAMPRAPEKIGRSRSGRTVSKPVRFEDEQRLFVPLKRRQSAVISPAPRKLRKGDSPPLSTEKPSTVSSAKKVVKVAMKPLKRKAAESKQPDARKKKALKKSPEESIRIPKVSACEVSALELLIERLQTVVVACCRIVGVTTSEATHSTFRRTLSNTAVSMWLYLWDGPYKSRRLCLDSMKKTPLFSAVVLEYLVARLSKERTRVGWTCTHELLNRLSDDKPSRLLIFEQNASSPALGELAGFLFKNAFKDLKYTGDCEAIENVMRTQVLDLESLCLSQYATWPSCALLCHFLEDISCLRDVLLGTTGVQKDLTYLFRLLRSKLIEENRTVSFLWSVMVASLLVLINGQGDGHRIQQLVNDTVQGDRGRQQYIRIMNVLKATLASTANGEHTEIMSLYDVKLHVATIGMLKRLSTDLTSLSSVLSGKPAEKESSQTSSADGVTPCGRPKRSGAGVIKRFVDEFGGTPEPEAKATPVPVEPWAAKVPSALPKRMKKFTYLVRNAYKHRKQVAIDAAEATVCTCVSFGGQPACLDERCLNRSTSTECHPEACRCGEACRNQRFQRLEYPAMTPVRTDSKGWGMVLDQDVSTGQFIIEYVGEVIPIEKYKLRLEKDREKGKKHFDFYAMALGTTEVVDASHKGNWARMINHSCDPNCATQTWKVNGELRVGIFALRDIPKGTELTYNYDFRCFGADAQPCFCGTTLCGGTIGKPASRSVA